MAEFIVEVRPVIHVRVTAGARSDAEIEATNLVVGYARDLGLHVVAFEDATAIYDPSQHFDPHFGKDGE